MLRILGFWITLSCIASVSFALDVSGWIQWNGGCPNIQSLRPSKVILDNGSFRGSILRDGNFSIPNVPPGTYILSLVAPDHSFDQLRIDVLDSKSTPEVRPYVSGTPLKPPSKAILPYPIILLPKQRHAYFVPHESFNLIGMLSNPMMLMMVAGAAMMIAMPYMMKNIDPEAMEEIREQHSKISAAVSNGDIKSGISAIMASEEAKAPATRPTKARGAKNKKR